MTWFTLVVTPLVLVLHRIGSPIKSQLIWLEWLVDISWSVEIVLNFFTVNDKCRTLKSRSIEYAKSFLIIDLIATVPPLLTGEKNDQVILLKMLRFLHILEIYEPLQRLIWFLMQNSIEKKKNNVL